jgi:hypothetical protein
MWRHLADMLWLVVREHAKEAWVEWNEYRIAVKAYKK